MSGSLVSREQNKTRDWWRRDTEQGWKFLAPCWLQNNLGNGYWGVSQWRLLSQGMPWSDFSSGNSSPYFVKTMWEARAERPVGRLLDWFRQEMIISGLAAHGGEEELDSGQTLEAGLVGFADVRTWSVRESEEQKKTSKFWARKDWVAIYWGGENCRWGSVGIKIMVIFVKRFQLEEIFEYVLSHLILTAILICKIITTIFIPLSRILMVRKLSDSFKLIWLVIHCTRA